MTAPSTLQATAIVAAGGAAGAVLRYHLGRMIAGVAGPNAVFPWPTFTINVVGSLLMGVLAGALARAAGVSGEGAEAWRLLMAVGVLGGFTTFSAFSLETAALIQRGLPAMAAIYAASSLIGGVLGLMLGLSLAKGTA